MKKQALRLVMLFALSAVAGVVSAQAQTAQHPVVVNVPFEFVVGGKTLPAGEYVIRRAARESDKALLVTSAGGGGSELAMTYAVEADGSRRQTARASVDFHRYGDKYFLFQVWTSGATAGRALPRSRQERDILREMKKKTNRLDIARLAGAPQLVTVEAK